MKRVLMIVTVLMATWLLQSVQAEGQRYSIAELNQIGQPEWKETYQANGRTVEVDCTVDIPDVSSFPVLTVQVMPPVEEPLYSALLLRYAAPKGTRLDYEFRSNDYQTVDGYRNRTSENWEKYGILMRISAYSVSMRRRGWVRLKQMRSTRLE